MADAGPLAAALGEIRAREQRATPGPWKAETDRGLDLDGDGWDIQAVNGPGGEPILLTMVDHPNKGDARFAAAARSDVPRLLAAVEAALAEAEKWKRFAAPGDAQDECADDLRAAITRALLGEEAPDGP